MVKVDYKDMFIYSLCPSEILHVSYDDGVTNLAFYSYGRNDNKTPWKYKLKHIWQILRCGTPYNDEITLSETGRTMLMEALKSHGIIEPSIETFTSNS